MMSFDTTWEKIHATQEWGKYPSEPVIRFIARNYYGKIRRDVKILDFGCGGGNHTWYLAKEGFDTYAFDGSPSAVRRTKQRLDAENLSADLRIKDALELNYQRDFFDCVIDNAAVYANRYDDIVGMYQEIFQLLKPGGKLFSVSFTVGTTGYGTGKMMEKNTYADIEDGSLAGRGIAHFFEEEELRFILERTGFENIVIDTLRYTDRGNVIEQFLAQADKGKNS